MWMADTVHDGISGGFVFDGDSGTIKSNSVPGVTDYANTDKGMTQVFEFITSSSFNWKEVGEGYHIRRGR